MRKLIILAAIPLLLASCITEPAKPNVTQVPKNYRAIVANLFKSSLKDPFSVRGAQISGIEPLSGVLTGSGQGVCVRLFAKNGFGAYDGMSNYTVLFRNGSAIGPFDGVCPNTVYYPFPELGS